MKVGRVFTKKKGFVSLLTYLMGGVLAVTGCAPEMEAGEESEIGTITLTLTTVPSDARCLQVTIVGAQTVTRMFDLTPGASSTVSMAGVPLGAVQVSEKVYGVPCASVMNDTPLTWVSAEPVTVVVQANATTTVPMKLVPLGSLVIRNDFVDHAMAVTPMDADLGSVTVGSRSSESTLQVRNIGRSPLSGITAVITGGDALDFAITVPPCTTLAVGASCSMKVVMRPRIAGEKRAVLRVSASQGIVTLAGLSGRGRTAAALAFTPGFYDFGPVPRGTTGSVVSFTLRNYGQTPTSSLRIRLVAGMDQNLSFGFVTSDCAGATLQPGDSCSVDIVARPLAGDEVSALRTADLIAVDSAGTMATASLRLVIASR